MSLHLTRDRLHTFAAKVLLIALSGCAMEVPYQPTTLIANPAGMSGSTARTTALTHFRLSTGYERTIPAMTEFVRVGEIPAGVVMRPISYVLTVEGANVHEAYAVVNGSRLVGFYLPFEHAFAPLSESVPMKFSERGE